MWARVLEIAIAGWLVVSPFVLGHDGGRGRVLEDAIYGAIVATLAVLSFFHRARHAHFGLLAVAAWLFVRAYFLSPTPPPGWAQNHLLVGLILLMLAMIPNEASKPPLPWRSPRPLAES
jgi:hypothetical protein